MFKKNILIISFLSLTELFERFSFYGIRSLILPFLHNKLQFSYLNSQIIIHSFFILAFSSSILMGIFSDLIFGKFKVIIFSLAIYMAGALFLLKSVFFSNAILFLTGLFLIAIGTGGIKTTLSNFGADQLTEKNDLNIFFSLYYFFINIGALLSIFTLPYISKNDNYFLSFLLIFLSSISSFLIFFFGQFFYKKDIQPETKNVKMNLKKILLEKNITKKMKKIFQLLPFFIIFSMCFDQQATSWTSQGYRLRKYFFNFEIKPAQMQTANAIFILILLPAFSLFNKKKIILKPERKIAAGLFFTALAFSSASFIEYFNFPIYFQLFQYFFISVAEILIAITGLEFLYKKSPEKIRSLMLALWYGASALGNLLTIIISYLLRNRDDVFLFANFSFLSLVFAIILFFKN